MATTSYDRSNPSDGPVVLLGPQQERPRVAETVAELTAAGLVSLDGRLAVITAGWEERESDDARLDRHLSGRTVNLGLLPRIDELHRRDPGLREAMAERERRRRELRDLYHLRLAPQLEACRRLLNLVEVDADHGGLVQPSQLVGPDLEHALNAVRALDRHHLGRIAALEAEMAQRWSERGALAEQRAQLAEVVDGVEAVLIAGGHVGTLLGALRLFDTASLLSTKPVVAWSAGAMVLGERVVLFHDRPARGAGDAEMFAPGLGLFSGLVPMPHARYRLALDDPRRVAMMARRLEPDTVLALDYGDRFAYLVDDPARTARVLGRDGQVHGPTDLDAFIDRRLIPRDPPTPITATAATAEAEREALIEAARSGADRLAAEVATRRFPIVGDGWVLYAFVGDADSVTLHHWIAGLPSAQPFERAEGTDLWTFVGSIQDRARVEYKFEVMRHGHTELIRDPLNHDEARDPFGSNSVVRGPHYVKPEWAEAQPTARKGRLVDGLVYSTVFGEPRSYSMYLPARFRPDREYPLLAVHDGHDYVDYAALVPILDNLIHRLEIPPLIAVLTQSPNRLVEYGANPDHGRFLVEDVLPEVEKQFQIGGPSRRVLMGASFGAVASLNTAWTQPGVFDKLLLQSGSFAFTDVGLHDLDPVFDPVVEFVNAFRSEPGRPAQRIFISVGVYERLVYYNRSLLPVLQSTGAEVRMVEAYDGHNWENWRDHLRDGLTYLLPGPQWLVYE